MADKLLIAVNDTFTKQGRIVSRGQTVLASEVDYVSPDEATDERPASTNLIEAPEGVEQQAVVEVAAIAPTGPNPQNPQQIAPDVVQTSGGYEQAGAKLVGEVTAPAEVRIVDAGIDKEDDTQAKVTQALADADADAGTEGGDANLSNEGTEGTVAQVSARVADMDAAQLDQLEKRENDREQPRKGVLAAVKARREALSLTA